MFIREIRAKMSDISFLCVFIYIFTQNETSAITRISVRVISLMRSVTLNDEDYFAVYDLAYPKYPFYCTCRLSRKMYPFLVNHQLQTVAAHCGYDLTQHHNAMADAYACAHIALTMMREKEVDTLEALMASCYSR